jgi:hypothetical protein
MQYYAKAIYSGLVAFLGSIGTALLAVDDAGFGDLSAGVWVAAGVLGLLAFGGVLGWQAAPASVSTSVR